MGESYNWAIQSGLRTDNFLSDKAKSNLDELSDACGDAGVDLSDTISRATE